MENIDPRLKSAYQQLQKSYKILQQCQTTWKETLKQCQEEINSLQNLSEQYTCCNEAGIDVLLLQLPDVREKLLYKISLEIDKKLSKLHINMNTLKECCDRISKQYDYSSTISKGLPLDLVTMTTETLPAFADMVEWLNDIDIMLHHQYWAKKHLLDTYTVQKFDSDNFMKMWNSGNNETTQKVNDALCYVKFLLDDT